MMRTIIIFELICLYYKCHNSFRNYFRDIVFVVRCRYLICLESLYSNFTCLPNREDVLFVQFY